MKKNLNEADVVRLLKKAQGKMSLRQFAKSIKVSAAYLSDIYRGKRSPGPTILTYLGFEPVTVFRKYRKVA